MYTVPELLPRVFGVISRILPLTDFPLTETTYLPGLKGFDSLFIANLLESLETVLQIEVEPTLLMPEAFETPRSVAELIVRSQKQYSSK